MNKIKRNEREIKQHSIIMYVHLTSENMMKRKNNFAFNIKSFIHIQIENTHMGDRIVKESERITSLYIWNVAVYFMNIIRLIMSLDEDMRKPENKVKFYRK